MKGSAARRQPNDLSGFTIVEVLVFLVIAVFLVGGVYKLLISQQRLYMKQRELQDVRGNLRAAANLLAFELRQTSALGGDLYSIDTYEIELRSMQAGGVVCARHGTQPRLGLYRTWGELGDSEADSAFIFATGSESVADDGWVVGRISEVWIPAGGGVANCGWSSSANPQATVEISGGYTPPDIRDGEIVIEPWGPVRQGGTVSFTARHPELTCSDFDGRASLKVDADPLSAETYMSGCTFTATLPSDAGELRLEIKLDADDYPELSDDISGMSVWLDLETGGSDEDVLERVRIGAPFRAFRQVKYGLYFDPDGRWWLGRKLGGAGDWERLTGPLSTPSDSGLAFVYYDLNGDTTKVATDVRMIDIILRGESFGKAPKAGEIGPQVEEDTLTIRVSLRG